MASRNENTIPMQEEDVEMWLTTLSRRDVDEVLVNLTLKRDGRRLEQLVRIQKWLGGDYSATDFEQLPDETVSEAYDRRVQLRQLVLNTFTDEKSGSTIADPGVSEREHPLTLYKSRGPSELTLMTMPEESTRPRAIEGVGTSRTGIPPTPSMELPARQPVTPTESATNRTNESASIEAKLLEIVSNLSSRMDSMAMTINEIKHGRPTASTRRESQAGHHVDFQDTFTVYGDNASTPTTCGFDRLNPNTTALQFRTPSQQNGWRGGGGITNSTSMVTTAATRDNGQVVGRWNLWFSGDPTDNIDTFLRS